jgi:hypothetical protein
VWAGTPLVSGAYALGGVALKLGDEQLERLNAVDRSDWASPYA